MAITRSLTNGNKVTEWTQEVVDTDNQYGLLNGSGLFSEQGTSQTSIVFDKEVNSITLLPQSHRNARKNTKGKDRSVNTFSLVLPRFDHQDYITSEDIQGWRMPGQSDMSESLANVRAKKLLDLRLASDQTKEFMKIQAIKGISKDAEGVVLADMFTEFGVSQNSTDFVLGTSTTKVDSKIAEVKRAITSNVRGGGAMTGLEIMVDETFFDKLISHPEIRADYLAYSNSGKQQMRDDLSSYYGWGVSDMFTHRGVTFYTYGATFTLPDGVTTEAAMPTDKGYTIVRGIRDLYRGYNGPSTQLSSANSAGSPLYVYEYTDPKDKFHELEIEFSSLYFMTKPLLSHEVTTSN